MTKKISQSPIPTSRGGLVRLITHTLLPRDSGQEIKWEKSIAVGTKELVLELNPVQAQGVQEALEEIHGEENAGGHDSEDCVRREHAKGIPGRNPRRHAFGPEDCGQLGVGQRERPQSQIRGSVRNRSKGELDRFDHLVNEHLAERVMPVLLSTHFL